MKKLIVASDSFKGTLSSIEICDIVKEVVAKKHISCNVICIPVADGGEGTVDSFVYGSNAREVQLDVTGPLFDIVKAKYAILDDTGIIEMAQAAGLPLVGDKKDPRITTTFGVGELIKDAIDKGCKSILLGLGGSATNDGGCGMLAALGVKFFDEDDKEFVPTGNSLINISRIDSSALEQYENIAFIAMCDVKNPLYGENGAAYIYGPQKGADEAVVRLLDDGLKHFAKFLPEKLDLFEGSGAAGGMGAGCKAFLGARLIPGAKAILDVADFDEKIKGASLVISGEGRVDMQSFQGKLLSELSERTKAFDTKLVVIAGAAKDDARMAFEDLGIEIFETSPGITDKAEIKRTAHDNYVKTLERVLDKYFE